MRRLSIPLCVALILAGWNGLAGGETYELHTFEKITLTTDFYAEGAGMGDFNQDGQMDVVYGPYWYEGPDFQKKHTIYPPEVFDPHGYSNNFITFVHDVNDNGFPDVLVNVWPGKEVFWYENPQNKDTPWKRHLAFATVDNESPTFGDLTGDGKPELIFHSDGVLGWAAPNPEDPTQPWQFHPISEKGNYQRYTHGLGFGDLTGNGRSDFLMGDAWWEQPDNVEPGGTWTKHPFAFGNGAQMHVYDVDGDGRPDVITSLNAHGYGLAWYQQVERDGQIHFVRRTIMGDRPEDNPYGLRFSQLHAVEVVDIDGDGLKDIVTGKRYWAHGPRGDVEPDAPAVLYWFKLVRTDAGPHFIPYLIDDDSGVGTQFAVGDVTGNGLPDIVIGNKKGGFVFRHEVKQVSRQQWQQAQPKPQPAQAP